MSRLNHLILFTVLFIVGCGESDTDKMEGKWEIHGINNIEASIVFKDNSIYSYSKEKIVATTIKSYYNISLITDEIYFYFSCDIYPNNNMVCARDVLKFDDDIVFSTNFSKSVEVDIYMDYNTCNEKITDMQYVNDFSKSHFQELANVCIKQDILFDVIRNDEIQIHFYSDRYLRKI